MHWMKTLLPVVLVWVISFPLYAADDDGDGIYVIDVLVVHPNAPGDHLQTLVNWGRAWGATAMTSVSLSANGKTLAISALGNDDSGSTSGQNHIY